MDVYSIYKREEKMDYFSKILQVLSHELKTPLISINWCLDFIEESLNRNGIHINREELKEYLKEINENLDKIDEGVKHIGDIQIINDLVEIKEKIDIKYLN